VSKPKLTMDEKLDILITQQVAIISILNDIRDKLDPIEEEDDEDDPEHEPALSDEQMQELEAMIKTIKDNK
jgi:hypothetical protein